MQLLMHPEAEVLAILGTGKQALSHYDVFTEMFAFKEVHSLSSGGSPALLSCKDVTASFQKCHSLYLNSCLGVVITAGASVEPHETESRHVLSACPRSGEGFQLCRGGGEGGRRHSDGDQKHRTGAVWGVGEAWSPCLR